jgi:AcrR family transcriptional regulator
MAIRTSAPAPSPAPSPAGTRRERARELARRDILLAAAEVFSRQGYASATLQELAEAAGFAAPSLYRYFQNKEEIFRSLVDLLVEDFGATFEAPVDPSLPLAQRLEALFAEQARLANAEHHRHMIALLRLPDAAAALAAAGRKTDARHAGLAFYEARVTGWLQRNVKKGELRVALELAATAIAGLAFAFMGCPDERSIPDPARTRALVDLVVNGVAAPINGRRGA